MKGWRTVAANGLAIVGAFLAWPELTKYVDGQYITMALAAYNIAQRYFTTTALGKAAAVVLLCAALLSPGTVSAQEWDSGFKPIDTRVLAGMTFSSGLSDPAANLSVNLPNQGWVVTYGGERVLELGAITGSMTGSAGNDANAGNTTDYAFGLAGCVAVWVCANGSYVFDTQAATNWVTMVNVDLSGAVSQIVKILTVGAQSVPLPLIGGQATPTTSYLPSFAGLNTLRSNTH